MPDIRQLTGTAPQQPEGIDWAARAREIAAAEAQEERDRIRRNFERCGAYKKDLREAGWEFFIQIENSPGQRTCMDVCRRFIESITARPSNQTLLLYGPSSTGKTYMALSALKYYCTKQRPPLKVQKADGTWIDAGIKTFHRGMYTTSEDACNLLMDKGFTGRAERVTQLQALKTTELLIIDEIGRSMQTEKKERDSLFDILNYRISNDLPSILCTNYGESEIIEFFGAALFNRINSVAVLIDTSNMPNMRTPEAMQKAQQKRAGASA